MPFSSLRDRFRWATSFIAGMGVVGVGAAGIGIAGMGAVYAQSESERFTPRLEKVSPSPLEDVEPESVPERSRDRGGASGSDPTDSLFEPEPFFGTLSPDAIVPPLRLDSLAPFPDFPELIETAEIITYTPFEEGLSPLERPMYQLFGFETANTLRRGELVLRAGGTSFNNPSDIRVVFGDEQSNRSNDIRFGFDYGITDTIQFSLGAYGKDDTIFAGLITPDSNLLFIYQGVPAQVKWQFFDGDRFDIAVVVGAEFASELVPARADAISNLSLATRSRKVGFSSDRNGANSLIAEDVSTYLSVGVPVSYQLSNRARLHFQPQVSFFPDDILVTNVRGSLAALRNADIGFVGDRLDYFGTVFGLGFGFDYTFSKHIKAAIDVTPILSGKNVADPGADGSLFSTQPVWNAGVQWAPNSRLGVNLYLTNRFGPLAASASRLLVQPDGDIGVGLDFLYLPDIVSGYTIVERETYPDVRNFFPQLNEYPSTTLPIGSAFYELGFGGNSQSSQTMRFGLLDDFELVLNNGRVETDFEQLTFEYSILGRLALARDQGRSGLSIGLTAGLLGFEGSDGAGQFGLYTSLPTAFRVPNSRFKLIFTPKFVIPAQALGVDNILGVSLGTNFRVADKTSLMVEYTPILTGDNVLARGAGLGGLQGNDDIYRLGVRQLLVNDNSAYAIDLYYGNSLGNYGLHGITTLPDGNSHLGVRFSVLNGIPARERDSDSGDEVSEVDEAVSETEPADAAAADLDEALPTEE
ncbi:MAG: hypothetical protein AAFX40_11685 [Cyanobacteria bacterium J06639_1]